MEKYELTDYQWNLIEPLIPPKTSTCGRARRNPRELINSLYLGVKNRFSLVCFTTRIWSLAHSI